MTRAVIVDAVRSPVGRGRAQGALAGVHPSDLLGQVLAGLVARNDLDPGLIDDVVIGCVNQSGEQSATPGRQALLAAGFPTHVPSVTVERKCGSGQQAIDFAVQGIAAGAYDIVVAGGVESMSRVPMGSAAMGKDPHGPAVRGRFPDLVPQGIAAELVAQKWALSRAELDEYSARSHERAAHARAAGWFDGEIVPVTTPTGVVTADETIREGTTAERLAGLPAAFGTDTWRERFPDLDWKVTAGNSSQISDGASALLIMSEAKAAALGLRPRAAIVASAVVGDDPTLMLTGPIPATEKVLARAGLSVADIAAFEVNEAFASVPLAWQREIGASDDVLNPVGGAVALGHPLGASGARLATTLISHLERTGGRYGLQTMCEAGGMANATIVERL
ncbi:thiolase family protein [Rhodococcus ruber]|uniref:Putative 3-ketoacyl-CoA thiolase/acetyl-CoA acetyltransferase n=1 Tax=Rhodococcus ruber TaxID=1830 RepID=A0A098BIH6_9NOCA|nr:MULTISPECIES: thiolase family protein [Rhodococcus]MDO2377150.1 thiolase family protein [Rhodococcus ruber]RIK03894.1 MAG: acetyl-CoA C-acyltransferase [Acidobacteriota bacterium]AXY54552.1 acetyl-CoA acetyltransferase [Rhodococcus ruber]MCD2124953.1 thiolase family protein [Rhodococcus ruber]MCZ1072723.1 thiolase family protein [Rhodococcus sp. A5(2022)]